MSNTVDAEGNQIKYEGFPFISNIDKYVQNELANRSLQRVRPIVPYIKVTPGFSIDGKETGKIVLKGIEAPNYKDPSEYKFKELYRPSHNLRPLAGVKSITADYLNAYGSIKKVTISWVCHTLEDLERLSPYFLNPGQSMFVEWGWGNSKVNEIINNNPKINLADYLSYVRLRKKLSNGNYDGMLGIVVNYSFALNRDGGFDCTTEVVSSGYIMEGITVSNQITQDVNYGNIRTVSTVEAEMKEKSEKEDEEQEVKVIKTFQHFMEYDFYSQISEHLNSLKFSDTKASHDYFLLAENGKGNGDISIIKGKEGRTTKYSKTYTEEVPESSENKESNKTKEITTTVEIPLRASIYASWGYLEDFVLNPHLAIEGEGTDKLLFGFDSRGSKISSHKFLRTTDLGVVIVPISNPGGGGAEVPDFKAGENTEHNLEFGYVRRLLINVELFREIMLNAKTINDAVLHLFSEINNVCINYWQFRLVPIEEKFDDSGKQDTSGTVTSNLQPSTDKRGNKKKDVLLGNNRKDAIIAQKIVDINYSNSLFEEILSKEEGPYVFRTKTFSLKNEKTGQTIRNVTSVVRNLSFQSKLSSQAALNVFYSAQNKDGRVMGTPSNNNFKSLYNFSINGIDYKNAKDTFSAGPFQATGNTGDTSAQQNNINKVDPGMETELFIVAQHAYGDKLLRYLPWHSKGYWVEIEKNGKKVYLTGKEGMKMAVLLSVDGKTPPSTSESLVPLECEVELEGISGIRIGDIFTIDHLPKIYQQHGTFQVIGITDTIDKNSWVTKLKAGFRVFKNIDYNKVVYGTQSFTPTETTTKSISTVQSNESDPAPKINPNHVGSESAIYTPVYMARRLNLRHYTKEQVLDLVKQNVLVEIGDANTNARFSKNMATAKLLDGKYYLDRVAAKQFLNWYNELVSNGINFNITSAARFGTNTGSGPHGYCIAVDFGNLWLSGTNTSPQDNLNGRIKSIEYTKIATLGTKWGWYNPWRLSDCSGQDEMWHFEYWGPAQI